MDVRRRIYEIVQPDDGHSMLSRLFDWLVTALIMASVVIVFASTFNLPRRGLEVLSFAEGIASVVFTIEYVLRILTALKTGLGHHEHAGVWASFPARWIWRAFPSLAP